MNLEPVCGLAGYLLSTPRSQIELIVAAAIAIGTLLYVTKIASISMVYGLGGRDIVQHEPSEVSKG